MLIFYLSAIDSGPTLVYNNIATVCQMAEYYLSAYNNN